MNAENLFQIANSAVLPAWGLLLIAPRWSWSVPLARMWALAYCILYIVLLWLHWGDGEGDFTSLAGVMALFRSPWLLLAGWVHYLAFDLFCGSWIVAAGNRGRLPLWRVLPALPLTLLFGPAGLLLFFLLNGDRNAFRTAA